ncbi:phosphate ABC transporter substrate-binding/OmpA family protein [Atopomonas sediminilitoris]|uniref:phosphate ABC transporter substrate-binding/OmpA family protein n=1 Tax=Atopomonas sediminilitoris TaxID=2919919 RepID=UPI001F4DFDC8|nr:phosphate ABC transporter substrate-binding/OmpA family protein [Atopomonas sediminilitoris]
MSNRLAGLLLAATILPASAATSLPIPTSGQNALRIEGSNTLGARLAPALVEGLMQSQGLTQIRVEPLANGSRVIGLSTDNRPVPVEIVTEGSSSGFVALSESRAQLAAASRPIKEAEIKLLASGGDMLSQDAEQVVAIDGVAVIVHPNSPLTQLSTAQLAAAFSGEAKNWEDLGVSGGPIKVMALDQLSGTFDTFDSAVLSPLGKAIRSDAQRFSSHVSLAEQVAQNPAAIGFVGLAFVGANKPLAIADGNADALSPQDTLVASEDYPLSRRLFLYIQPNESNAWARALIEYAQSPAGQKLVAANGFVSQAVRTMQVPVETQMPESYKALASQAKRLSVTFRFKEGNAKLDNKALQDVQRVANFIKANNKSNQQVALIGFSDSKEDAARAELVSKLRAMAVRRELSKAGVNLREVQGLGQAMPIASNDVESGRIRNRRVEVWVY